ncbi:hypothetical protein BCU85_17350 [Vibrio lentus]|uniref:hypothetical protein n=1 Tax=Vibrio lentus TaxID=136468 RepID=UPI000C83DB3D|nr:hypothetical protein [Vibrio lentus]MCC4818026.1 hypothetical protein [Vibrio lentus]PMG72963.1 hypothetical protein BCU85_17350 [Vibrio lentus]PMK89923.1 hypothetical protein BCT88_21375 [Vibrio lentus]PML25475.1 hypothetical protein BCT80_19495 [Vibrio lentus]PMM27951.1 hypothetical protein BCT57_15820 [Vibrio lentus]
MTDRKEYMADYYEQNKTRLLEKAKEAHQKAVASKTFGTLLNELTDSRIKLEAAMLQDVLGQMDKKLEPDHIALLWKQYKQEHKHAGFVTMSNVDDHKQSFLIWMER